MRNLSKKELGEKRGERILKGQWVDMNEYDLMWDERKGGLRKIRKKAKRKGIFWHWVHRLKKWYIRQRLS